MRERIQRLQRWWQDYDLLDHPGLITFMFITGCTALIMLVAKHEEEHPPHADEAMIYCTRECNTSTLQLESIELHNVGTGRGATCHCKVRPESLTGGKSRLDGGVP